MAKRKHNYKVQKQITGSLIPGLDIIFGFAESVLGWLGNILWDCIKFLGITGLTALRDLIVDLWKDGTKRKLKTDNLKAFIILIKRKLLRKNPEYKNDPIFVDISELNRLCYYIENLNQDGMDKEELIEIRKLAAKHIKTILKQFKKLMSAPDTKEVKKEDKPKEDDEKKEHKDDDKKKDDKPKEEVKKTTNRRYRRK